MLNTYVAEGKAVSARVIRSTLVDVFRGAIAEGACGNESSNNNPCSKVRSKALKADS
ncbi:integrase [Escherichia coli]|nr:integrase [Escherichia coli]GDM67788.1 integrase [Escherichia coli]GDP76000.1 integrase [Escherichia coli]GDP76039.1 integrase [Escherichia coli]